MLQITLNAEQAKVVASALAPVQVRDSQGNVLGTLTPLWTEDDLADAGRRLAAGEAQHTTAEVLEYLRSLG